MIEPRELFEISQKSVIEQSDFLKATELCLIDEQLNYQDPKTKKTSVMAYIENKNKDMSLMSLILGSPNINLSLLDDNGKNLLHYLIENDCKNYIYFFEKKRDVINLLFVKDKNSKDPWEIYQNDFDFIEDIDNGGLIYDIHEKHNIIERILQKIISLNNQKNKKEIISSYQCLEIFLDYEKFIKHQEFSQIEKYFISNNEVIFNLVEGALQNNAQKSFQYFIAIIKKFSITADRNRGWLMKSLHKDDKKLYMFKGIIKEFGSNYFNLENEKGLNPAHILSMNNDINGLNLIKKEYGDNLFQKQDKLGRMPFHFANHEKTILFFNKIKTNFNALDNLGKSVLHYIFEKEIIINFKRVSFLFETFKMDLSLKDKNVISPFDLAMHFNKTEALKKIMNVFCKNAPQESILSCVKSAQKAGCIDVLKTMNVFIKDDRIQKEILNLINHNNAFIIEKISKSISLSSEVGDVDVEIMKYAVEGLRHKLGEDFYCDVLNLDEMKNWIDNIKINIKNYANRNIYYLITNDAHWICGEIHIMNSKIEKILLMDPMIDQTPTDKVYESFSNSFDNAEIYISGVSKQGNDTFCPFYCLNDIKHLFEARDSLPIHYNKNLYAYLNDHLLSDKNLKRNTIKKLRESDKICDLPACLKLTVRSLNGQINSYRERGVVFWVEKLKEEEKNKFISIKNKPVEEVLDKHISNGLNKRIEYKTLKTRDNLVLFYSSSKKDKSSSNQFQNGTVIN